ncbi:MAG: hypothetical protein DWH96_03510 [Planctomycetota bacterium]|jgi:hypothetical protein|nr:MAG: hypothetical protein DWH96_03510 [Planctomycetota bacterium]RLS96601.1 MAG: hypothetical protein DWI11_00490 [Planctomycetota bacterium]
MITVLTGRVLMVAMPRVSTLDSSGASVVEQANQSLVAALCRTFCSSHFSQLTLHSFTGS